MLRAIQIAIVAAMLAGGPAQADHAYGPGGTVRLHPEFERQWIAQLRAPTAIYGTPAPIDLNRGARRAPTIGFFVPRQPPAAAAPRLVVAPPPAVRVAPAAPVRAPAAPPARTFDEKYLPTVVSYQTRHKPGTIVVDTGARFLYLVMEGDKARRYGIGVGRQGFSWKGTVRVARKAEWPGWTPPAEMRKRQPNLPTYMAGGPNNPLGARALYLYDGGRDTLFRIHGSNEPWTIGQAVSSGCFRMRNDDVIDLYNRVPVGAKVVVI